MEKQSLPVTNPQELTEAMVRCRAAQKKFAEYTQEQVDRIFLAAATAANQMRIPLAKLAVEVGLVVGITAAITPMGSAMRWVPKAVSSSRMPQDLASL